MNDKTKRLLHLALILSIITIGYNVIEGIVSVFYGISDDTLALLGFGLDSFVEVISGIGILHMVLRMRRAEVNQRDRFEKTALRITGTSFFLLAFGLFLSSVINVVKNHQPETTLVGIIVSLISIMTMYFLMESKLKVGKSLNSDAIIADANCTRTCFYLSIILLFSSFSYELLKIGYFDVIGSMGIAIFAFKEGKESFEKSNSEKLNCSCSD